MSTAIVLLNMGGPSDLESVRPFLVELFSDPELIDLPLILKPFQRFIANIIAKFRFKKTQSMYEQIGGGSPVLDITNEFADKLQNNLGIPVFVVMRYTQPRSERIVKILGERGIKRVILFSQYPFYSRSTSSSSINEFKLHLNFDVELDILDNWGSIDPHIFYWVDSIEKEIKELETKSECSESLNIVFSAHGLPTKYVNNGEKYPSFVKQAADQIEELLVKRGHNANFHLSYQSKVGPVEWLKPYTDDIIRDLSNSEALIIVPLGFLTDHVETLFEIDIEYQLLAKEMNIKNFARAAVPNADPIYVKSIAEYIRSKFF